jgi:hypothetical protein
VLSAERATLLEEPAGPLDVVDGAVVVPFRPWEIVTVRISG